MYPLFACFDGPFSASIHFPLRLLAENLEVKSVTGPQAQNFKLAEI